MKQHITLDQLNELSENAQAKLDKWWSEKYEKIFATDPYFREQNPLLSIGQMIEFLQTYKPDRRFKLGYPEYIDFCQEPQDYDYWQIKPDTLCDDLWEAVKEVLER